MKSFAFYILLACFVLIYTQEAKSQAGVTTFRNPVSTTNGADPFVTYYNGFYYYLRTTGNVTIYKCSKLYDLEPSRASQSKTVYNGANSNYVSDVWAPELHHFGNKWYIYTCGQPSNEYSLLKIMVLESTADDPMSNYVFKGGIDLGRQTIDATVFTYNDQSYLVCSYYHPTNGQSILLVPMKDPWTVNPDSCTILSSPQGNKSYAWERNGWAVNEGPAVLQRNDKVYIVYSASGYTSGEYCLGMLTYNGVGDITDRSKWTKAANPVFQKGNGQYSVGHCSFTQSPNGEETWMVYHGVDTPAFNDDPKGRTPRLKKVTWVNDVPSFGAPDDINADIPIPAEETTPVTGSFYTSDNNGYHKIINQ